ncbi:hypothetical protein Salat_1205100 [Sesamum alatum]|uniref:Uncharacterized protein n=1 Tax=Sesamum alatum TaxID=300844 RepID=A0AAE2CNU9_9LAMI|nr:hypothetical protein Salat_1205100 [Sesamum alatum]
MAVIAQSQIQSMKSGNKRGLTHLLRTVVVANRHHRLAMEASPIDSTLRERKRREQLQPRTYSCFALQWGPHQHRQHRFANSGIANVSHRTADGCVGHGKPPGTLLLIGLPYNGLDRLVGGVQGRRLEDEPTAMTTAAVLQKLRWGFRGGLLNQKVGKWG